MQQWLNLAREAGLADRPHWFCDVLWGGNAFTSQPFATPGLEGHVLSVPAGTDRSGGDVHHVTVCGQGVFSKFLLLDVAGHGELAARWSRRLHEPLHRLMQAPDNAAILAELNDIMHGYGELGRFATAVAATWNNMDKSWIYAYAGHPYMLIRQGGQWRELPATGERTVPIGIMREGAYYQSAMTLEPGTSVLMFSDALTEMRRADGTRPGVAGLLEMLNELPGTGTATLYRSLIEALVRANGGERFEDDLTLVLLRRVD